MIKCQSFGWLSSQSIWAIAQYPRGSGYLVVVWEFLNNKTRKDYHESCFFNACWKLVDYCISVKRKLPSPQKTNKPTLLSEEGRGVLFVLFFNHSKISSFGWANFGFVSWGQNNIHGLKITEKWRHCLFSAVTI